MKKEEVLKAMLEMSNKENAVKLLVDLIYEGNIEIKDAEECAKEICHSYCELIVTVIIANAFKDVESGDKNDRT